MPTGLRRYQQTGNLHFINFNCFRKRPIFDTLEPRTTFCEILEETRDKYRFEVHGYVVMPTHIHLLLSEPPEHSLSTAIQVIKQRFARTRIEKEVWEARYYDFNVFTERKRIEKLAYIHNNPITAGLATTPGDWPWSSYGAHTNSDLGPVHITT